MPDMLKTEIVIKLDAADCRLRDQIVSMKITETKLLKQKHTFHLQVNAIRFTRVLQANWRLLNGYTYHTNTSLTTNKTQT
jgi:hypothetical protein